MQSLKGALTPISRPGTPVSRLHTPNHGPGSSTPPIASSSSSPTTGATTSNGVEGRSSMKGATTSWPLHVSFSLANAPVPKLWVAEHGLRPACEDVFDVLDRGEMSWSVEGEEETTTEADRVQQSSPTTPQVNGMNEEPLHSYEAMSDSTSTLFPLVNLSSIRDQTTEMGEDLPSWLVETSRRVTAIASTYIEVLTTKPTADGGQDHSHPVSSHSSRRKGKGKLETEDGEEGSSRRCTGKTVLRVAVGCEDGSLWILSPSSSSNVIDGHGPAGNTTHEPTVPRLTLDHPSRRATATSTDSLSAMATSASTSGPNSPTAGRSVPVSPPVSPKTRSRPPSISLSRNSPTAGLGLGSAIRPPLATHSSANSVHSLASNNRKRVPSGALSPTSPTASPLGEGHVIAPRPRKASATVGISMLNTGSSVDLLGMHRASIEDISRAPSTTPMSRSNTSNGGHRVASSSASVVSNAPSSAAKRHHRAKDSITTGIGLWEAESNAATSIHDGPGPTSPPLVGGEEKDLERAQKVEEKEETPLMDLVPLIRVQTIGSGEIVGMKIVDGLAFAPEEGGRALIVLRRKGVLSAHSLIDGRAFARCDVSSKVPLDSTDVQITFLGLKMVQLADITFALCFGTYGVGFVAVNLDDFVAQDVVEGGTGPGGAAIIFKQGVHFIVFASPTTSSSTATAELVVRPLIPIESKDRDSQPSSPGVKIEPAHSAGVLEGLTGSVRGFRNCVDDLLVYSSSSILLFTIRDQKVIQLALARLEGIIDVSVEGYNNVLVATKAGLRLYRLEPSVAKDATQQGPFCFRLMGEVATTGVEWTARLPESTPSATYLVARSTGDGQRELAALTLDKNVVATFAEAGLELRVLLSSGPARKQSHVTCLQQLDGAQVIVGYSTGEICVCSLGSLVAVTDIKCPDANLSGAISLLSVVKLGGRDVVIAGAFDGTAGAWNLSDWDEIGRWCLFASPVTQFTFIQDPTIPQLSQTIAFVSANSPIALVSLFPPALLFVLPGTKSPVISISTLKEEILVVYAHGLARVCDVTRRELRRSMDAKTARGVLAEGKWSTWFTAGFQNVSDPPTGSLIAPILNIDLRQELERGQRLLPWIESKRVNRETAMLEGAIPATAGADEGSLAEFSNAEDAGKSGRLDRLRFLLSHLATFELDSDTDELISEHLGAPKPDRCYAEALQSTNSLAFPFDESSPSPWTISPIMTAQRLLQLVCVLRFFLNFPDTERYASQAIVFYSSFLDETVGEEFEFPSLNYLADFWLDTSTEVQQATRTLFGTYLAASSDARVEALVEQWQDALPARQSEMGSLCEGADQAVLVVGLIACERFSLLSPMVLKDLTASLVSYIQDFAHPYHQSIAVELCARGFVIFQNYVDAMELVRHLFGLATGRDPSTPPELRLLAKHATLQVASVNTPLFMTTLIFDILNAPSASHRNATLKLLGFMIRKKPLVLLTSLPRLAEAVVKSLDPTVTALRKTVHQAATVILNELVRTYPSIDFHGSSQRLAVGTHEGAAIIYDLKTATRMYVLEGHKRAVTAVSWSRDGHRLVTVSLEESKVVVWKVGIGLFSLLMPGAAPRQTTGLAAAVTTSSNASNGTSPFKQYEFHVGDEALMTNAATLEWVTFDWPGERTVRLRIRETALNFGC
ncbi:BZ3500_MvSof-1268-A1-R1_Chr10-1g02649 [Microbotryum saponariae]|uniref:BZ3500_MvSof-1268-A1-R1_Chr10-1g02649 protein n=1 Tax=Microbotryum saponariae TaxID=289078 RepID=A0A2X0LLT2_9BASI|nr:BZ3500_MvSof-1268-A1-R1_Chr10-1g02649 [Microbotryum saponariae]SDA06138.1 BZ3501_MvSof-1269-A2-R1_Chr10-1g02250 [Microbotryum saponariae]